MAAQWYTFVKRSGDPALSKKLGGPKFWLNVHIALSTIGLVAILLHAGFPYQFRYTRLTNAGYAGLATWLLLVTAVSGAFGRYLYSRLPAMRRWFRVWKPAHIVTTALFFFFALAHIATASID